MDRKEMLEILSELVQESCWWGDEEQQLLNFISELENVETSAVQMPPARCPFKEDMEQFKKLVEDIERFTVSDSPGHILQRQN